MSDHVEWAEADSAAATAVIEAPGEFQDAYGTVNNLHALTLDNGSGLIAIEGDLAALGRFGATITDLVQKRQRFEADLVDEEVASDGR